MKNELPIINVDILIVGAGPAGLAAAISAKKAGVDSLVVLEREENALGYLRTVADLIDHLHKKNLPLPVRHKKTALSLHMTDLLRCGPHRRNAAYCLMIPLLYRKRAHLSSTRNAAAEGARLRQNIMWFRRSARR